MRVQWAVPVIASILILGTLGLSQDAFAAIDMFLKIDGIDGESTDNRHDGDTDVLGWNWGLSQSANPPARGGGEASKVSFQDMSITKFVDSATSEFMLFCCKAENIGDVTLEICRTIDEAGDRLCYFKIEMERVFITSMSLGGSSGDDILTETITLNFEKIEFTYTPHDPDTGVQTGPPIGWSIDESKGA